MVKEKTRGEVAPEKTQVNWRILTQPLEELEKITPKLGFSATPATINFILVKVTTDAKAYKAVFGVER